MNNANDGVKITGFVTLKIFDKEGVLKDKREISNLVVTTGKNHIADRLSSTPGENPMTYMAIGTGTTPVTISDTQLETQLDRNLITSIVDVNNTVTYTGNWAAGDGTGTITEAGIFNAAINGVMLARTVFSPTVKGVGDSLQITWVLTIG